MDICLVRAVVLVISAFLMTKFTGSSIKVDKQDRCKVFVFTLFGTFGFVFLLFGVSMVPLLVQSTLLNTAPFWASLLGFAFLRESLSGIEIMALILSFTGVFLVAYSARSVKEDDDGAESDEQGESNSTATHLLGCFFILLASLAEAGVTLIARRLQSVSFSVMLFWYGFVAVPCNIVMVLSESWINQVSIRFWDYGWSQYGWMLLITVLNFIGISA